MSGSSRSDIQERVMAVISEVLSIDVTEINVEASISDDLGANSIDKVELILTIEHEFGGSIAEEDIEKIVTVGDAIDYVENKLNAV